MSECASAERAGAQRASVCMCKCLSVQVSERASAERASAECASA